MDFPTSGYTTNPGESGPGPGRPSGRIDLFEWSGRYAGHVRTSNGKYEWRWMFMRRTGFALLAGLLVLSIAEGGWAAEPAGTSPARKVEPPSWKTSSVIEGTATVEAIDQSSRMVTLKGPKGNSVTFKAGDEVRNLAQVKVGDEVKFAYYESLAVRVLKKGEAFPTAGEMGAMARAEKGEMPAGVVGKAVAVNA